MLKTAPAPVDVQDLQFKLHCRLKVFENVRSTDFARDCSLVACASRFGLIFVGTNAPSIQAIQLRDVERYSPNDGDRSDYPRRIVPLPSPPSHLSVNCEHSILATIFEKNSCFCAVFYDVKSFYQGEIVQIGEVRLSPTPGVHVTEVNWNPTLGPVFTACKSDGTLGIYEIKATGVDINELPAAAGATCFCWSPKGKQIAIGSRDGKITQLKPDLKAVKVINAPPLKEPHILKSLQWVSNYQFIGAFQSANPEGQAVFIVVDAPKVGDPTYVNYDDICYSNGNARPVQFYTILLHSWNVLMAASSNSMEVGILGNSGECWTQWSMGDAARAELPLSGNRQETLPVGCALDIGSTQPLPWGESTLPPTPLLLLYSNHGALCVFNIVNLRAGAPSICSPPEPIKDASGLQHFVAPTEPQKAAREVAKVAPNAGPPTEAPNPAPSVGVPSAQASLFKVQPQAPAPGQGLNLSKPQSVNLFGGQATLTPIAQPSKAVQVSYPSAFANESKPILTVPVVQTPSSAISVVPVAPKPATGAPPDAMTAKVEVAEDLAQDVPALDLRAEEEAERIFSQMVREECVFLESELKAILHQGRNVRINLGSDEDRTRIVESTRSLEEFFREVTEICQSQNSEVHVLKQNLLQSWAWYEEARSRQMAARDESMMILVRAQPLDSASEKQRADIQHTNYYLESQVTQAHMALDEQWEQFQDYCKKTHKIQIPTMEMIFQTLVKQNAIIRKQSYVLKDIGSRMKSKSRGAVGPSLIRSVDDLRDLPDELKRLRMNPEDIIQIQYQHVTNRMKSFSAKKVDDLRSFLKRREYSHVSVVKPQMSTSLIQASPSSRLKQYSWLAPTTPPVVKKKLDFVQSTPKPMVAKPESGVPVPSSTPIEGLQSFALKFEAKHFANDKTFTPVAKSVIASSPNSAFVSTSFGSSTSASPAVPSKPSFLGMPTATTAVVKATPSFVAVTTTADMGQPVLTISVNNPPQSKAFSFASLQQEGVTSAPKVTSSTQPAASFGLGQSIFAATNVATSKPQPPSAVLSGLLSKPAVAVGSVESTTKAATTGTIFGTTSTFAFGTGSSSIFGASAQKSEPKPLGFAPKTTAQGLFAPTVSTSTVTSPVSSATTSSGSAKDAATTQPSIFGAVAVTTKSVTPAVVTVPSSFVTGSSVPAVPASSFPLSGTKPSVFATSTVTAAPSTAAATPSTTSSIFGTQPLTTKPSIFGSVSTLASSSSPSSGPTKPLFGSSEAKPSIFGGVGTPATSSVTSTTSSAQSSIFGAVSSSTDSGAATTSTAQPPLFGVATTTQSIFGSTPSSFGTPSTQSSIFGATPSTSVAFATASTPTSIFNTTASTVFGTTTTTAQSSLFGSTPTTSLFGAPITSTSQSVFGVAPPSSVFGSTAPSQPIFGQSSTPTTTQPPAFGMFGDQAQKSSVFGAPTTTQSSVFGTNSQPSAFGGTTSSSSSVFGQSQTNTFGQSVFGSSGTTFGGSAFGGASQTFGQSGGSVFGGTPTTSAGSIFGGAPSTGGAFPSGGNVFGTPVSSASPPFGSSNIFSSNATEQKGGTGAFGFGGLSVGATATTSSSAFGASAPPNPFGGDSKSVFGGTPTSSNNSVFGSNSGSLFGSPAQSFGATPAFGGQPAFAQQSTFGQQGSFGSATFSGPFSSGSTAGVGQTGFGTSSNFQKPAGFGGSPVFGGTPAFGSAPSFGGAPAFGSSPTFGGATKVFGGTNTGFGAAPASPGAGFGNLANQPTVGFGNLAQQAAAPGQSAPFSGNSSFSSWR